MASWPSNLPQKFSGDGTYQELPADIVLRTAMDAGITKTRRRMTIGEDRVSGTILLNEEQAFAFSLFFKGACASGANPFTGSLGRLGVIQTFLFEEVPTLQHIGGTMWQLNMKLKVLNA